MADNEQKATTFEKSEEKIDSSQKLATTEQSVFTAPMYDHLLTSFKREFPNESIVTLVPLVQKAINDLVTAGNAISEESKMRLKSELKMKESEHKSGLKDRAAERFKTLIDNKNGVSGFLMSGLMIFAAVMFGVIRMYEKEAIPESLVYFSLVSGVFISLSSLGIRMISLRSVLAAVKAIETDDQEQNGESHDNGKQQG